MKILQSKLFVKITMWLCAEIALNLVGMDDLADYSEFIWQDRLIFSTSEPLITLVISV